MKMQPSIATPLPLTIVVEKRDDADVLRRLLSESQREEIRFFAAQGRIAVPSLARNILVFEGTFVLVIVDADSRDVSKVQGQLSALLGFIASPKQFGVFIFEPSLASIMGNMNIGENDALSDEQRRQLLRNPQVEQLLNRVAQLQSSSQEEAPPHVVHSAVG